MNSDGLTFPSVNCIIIDSVWFGHLTVNYNGAWLHYLLSGSGALESGTMDCDNGPVQSRLCSQYTKRNALTIPSSHPHETLPRRRTACPFVPGQALLVILSSTSGRNFLGGGESLVVLERCDYLWIWNQFHIHTNPHPDQNQAGSWVS